MAIIVMGVSGSGKSTLGALLAGRLGCPFIEGDAFHAPASVEKMRGGTPLTDADRWPWLDRLGTALRDALAEGGTAVAACSALRRAYRQRLCLAAGTPIRFILLDNEPQVILRRMRGRAHFMPPALLDSQFATLERPSADECATTLVTDAPAGILCEMALEWLDGGREAAAG
jgi:gluconokinase